jgi:hypothetical protein
MVRIASTSSCIRRNKKLPFLYLSLSLSLSFCLSVPLSFCRSLSLYVYIQRESTTCCDTSTCVSSGRCSSMPRRFHYYICVLILLHVSSYYDTCLLILHMHVLIIVYVSSYYYMCVLILLCMCPHTTICASSYCYACVLILQTKTIATCMCPHTTGCVFSYLLHTAIMCPHATTIYCPHTSATTMYVSSYLISIFFNVCRRRWRRFEP